MYLNKTTTFPHQPLKSISKVAVLHRFYCIVKHSIPATAIQAISNLEVSYFNIAMWHQVKLSISATAILAVSNLEISSFNFWIVCFFCFSRSFSSDISYRILFLAFRILFKVFPFFSSTEKEDNNCQTTLLLTSRAHWQNYICLYFSSILTVNVFF